MTQIPGTSQIGGSTYRPITSPPIQTYPPYPSYPIYPVARKIKRVEYHENGNVKLVEYED